MKLVCSQAELNAALQLVSRAVASRPTHPVLANVLLTADAGTDRLSLTGFDLNLGIQTSLPASVDTSGAVTLPARLLGEIVSKLSSDSPVSLSSDAGAEQVELTSSIDELSMTVSTKEQELSKAKSIREEEHAVYAAAEKELSETVDSLDRSTTVLKNNLGLVQGRVGTAMKAMAAGLSKVID